MSDRIGAADRLQYWVARALGSLPPALQLWMSGAPPHVVDRQTLDPHLALLREIRRIRCAPGLIEPDPLTARRRFRREMRALAGPPARVAGVRDLSLGEGAVTLPARHYAPDRGAGQPLLVYLHGGGFVIGDLDTHDRACRILCREGRVHVLAVDYRLAPEHPFPAALDDATAALRWARRHAASLGADPGRVAIGGDSAGGNLAAVVSGAEAARGAAPFVQLLIYPVVDTGTERASSVLFGDGYFLSRRDRELFSLHYTGGIDSVARDPRVAPLRSPSLAGQPPALVVTAGFDILRDEGEEYARALAASGVAVRHRHFASLGHGFVNMTGITPSARAAVVAVARELRALIDETERTSAST